MLIKRAKTRRLFKSPTSHAARSCYRNFTSLCFECSWPKLFFYSNWKQILIIERIVSPWPIMNLEFMVTVHYSLWAKCTQLWPLNKHSLPCSPWCTEIWVSEFVKQAGGFFFFFPWIISALAYFSRPVARLVWRLVLVSWSLIISSES